MIGWCTNYNRNIPKRENLLRTIPFSAIDCGVLHKVPVGFLVTYKKRKRRKKQDRVDYKV